MSINRVSGVAVSLLGSYLAQQRERAPSTAPEESTAKLGELYQLIRRRFEADHNDFALSTIQQLKEQPDHREAQAALSAMLTQKTRDDPGFAQELGDRVSDAVRDEGIGQMVDRFF